MDSGDRKRKWEEGIIGLHVSLNDNDPLKVQQTNQKIKFRFPLYLKLWY